MASKKVSVLFVKKEFLLSSSCPPAFQAYIAKYFAPTRVFGIDSMCAFQDPYGSVDSRPGVAPSRSQYLREEVSDGVDLFTWLEGVLGDKNQTNVMQVSRYWRTNTPLSEECD